MNQHPRTAPGLHNQLLDRLGMEICSGERAPGSTLTLEELERTHGVSRSVVRETVRVLESMQLLVSKRRVGIMVLESSQWNQFEPRVIRWRMQSPERQAQLDALIGLRLAIEPEAARLAALQASASQAAELVGIAGRMWAASEENNHGAFHELDLQFHALILAASGNPMFAQLEAIISEFLEGWHARGLGPGHPHPIALQLHADVAAAVQRRAPDEAFAVMRSLLTRSAGEAS
ncbi:FadR/GntR family transcriptional regulator [Arthrobacter sp. YN]|uniref:FadR/GntR family transcriptional regulator n=1 Tax=Arthrobacter sp. YN TaxID=2020486 RepID=UPI000B611011|nr:FCD domain-containing protein [Arthrobacter sp. YN]ASN22064.1 GntR family transcriptional regulator [Arthrobacter sp. YN]